MTHRLDVRGLSKHYGRKPVLKEISLHASTSEIVGLLGPNGAGKTTTFYSILGMVRPDSGSILLDGADVSSLPMFRRALMGISYLPQEPSIFRKLTVRENIRAVLEIKGLAEDDISARTEQLLREFGLEAFADREGFKLSGGERRRTEIARALATDPVFILFDEPFAGIDPLAIIELKKMLTYLRGKGLGIIITDHNVRDTLSITDRSYIISNGAILEEGTPAALVAAPHVKEAYLGEEFSL